jgi:uncharacterized protein YkwD
MRRTAIVVALAIAGSLSVWTPLAHACRATSRAPSESTVNDARRAVTCLINRLRVRHHLRPVHGAVSLGIAAQGHSDAMTAYDFFAHEGGDGTPSSRAAAAGYAAGAGTWGVGENLGFGTRRAGSPRTIVDAWMRSGGHRVVLFTKRFRQIGVGITKGSPFGADSPSATTYTVLLGYRKG